MYAITRMSSLALLVCAAVTIGAAPHNARQSTTPKPYKITALRAQLFYETLNKFSGDVFSEKGLSLWNVVIGEGTAEGPASNVLVTVEVSGEPGTYANGKRKVTLVASANNKTILTKTSEVNIIGKKGTVQVPFWLYDVGSVPVRLRATLKGQGTPVSVTKVIPFAGGE